MTEHLTEPEIERYRHRVGENAARETTAAHLAVCQQCVKRVYAEHPGLAVDALTEAFLASEEESFHLSNADLRDYASGSADKANRIICESHLDVCEQCKQELRLLSGRDLTESQQPPISREQFVWLRPAWWANSPMRMAAAIGLIGLLAFGVLLIWRRPSAPAPGQLTSNHPREAPGISAPVDTGKESSPAVPDTSQPSIVIQLKDNGKEIGLDHQGRLVGVSELDEATQRLVKSALAGEPLAKPKVLAELTSPRIELLGESAENSFQLISPLGKIITETRPTLSWKRMNGATTYVASLFDSKFNLVTRSAPLSQPAWTVSIPLQRGQNYFWEVAALKEGKEFVVPVAPAPRAQFKILEADKLSALQNLRRQKPTSRLALGLTYARFGMVKDAEAEFQRLLKDNPDSAVAKRLLHTVQIWR